jgi:DNA-binding SARP family transcriptional activator
MNARIAELLAESRAQEKAGAYAAALRLAEAALAQARSLDDQEGICGGHTHVANVHWRMGHFDLAHDLATEALKYAAAIPDTVTAHHLLGLIASETGEPDAAEGHFHRAADLSRQIGYRLGLSLALNNLATQVYVVRGQFELALSAMAESYQINHELGYPNWAYPLLRAAIYRLMGEGLKARQALDELAQNAAPGSLFDGLGAYLRAQLALDEDDPDEADLQLKRARPVADATGNPALGIWVQLTQARLHRLQGEWAAAGTWADEGLAFARRARIRLLEGEALLERAQVYRAAGEPASAEADLGSVIELLEPLRAALHLAWAHFLRAQLYHQQGRPEAAAAWQEASTRIARGGYAFLLQRERALAFPLLAAKLRGSRGPERRAMEGLLQQLARVPPTPLHITGLGRFEVRQGRRLIAAREWLRRKAGELFRYLLLQPRRAAAHEAVLEALWPEQPTEAARDQLYQATSTVRRILEPELPDKFASRYLVVEADSIELCLPSGSSVDYEHLEAAVEQGGLETREDAAGLLEGELFPADRYADWAAAARERLAQVQLRGLVALARARLDAEQPQAALDACRLALGREPWTEEAVAVGMRACLALNDRPGALRLYQDLASTLQRELRLTPRADLRALAESLRAGQ